MKRYSYNKAPNISELSVFTGLGTAILDMKTLEKDIPCQSACPAKTNVPAYIEEIFKGNHDAAYRINLEDNVFPGALGRICTRPCEDKCRHNWTNVQGPVQICHLKRVSADHLLLPPESLKPWYKDTEKRVAVVGGGPAGLTAARELKRYGHEVSLFEREKKLGGMLINGIPKFRLPIDVVQREIALIADSGIKVHLGADIDQDRMKGLIDEYDAVLLATGTMLASQLELKTSLPNVFYGNDFMYAYNNNQISSVKGDVVIIGGGFTAVDCSRSCARAARKLMGEGKDVTIVYRRTEEFMAANYEERQEIVHENIKIRTLCTPVEIVTGKNGIEGVKFVKNKLKYAAGSDKPFMVQVEGSEFVIPCEMVIIAIGQQQDYSVLNGIKADKGHHTSNSKLFTVGDFRTGSKDVISAVADGKEVADKIDTFLTGMQRKKYHVSVELLNTDGETGRFRDHDLQEPDNMPVARIEERDNNAEVELGLAGESIETASSRCYFCQYKFEIDHDKCIHCDWCIEVAPRNCISKVSRIFIDDDGAPVDYLKASKASEATYIHIDSNECIRCGKCLRVCPTEAITLRRMTKVTCPTDKNNALVNEGQLII